MNLTFDYPQKRVRIQFRKKLYKYTKLKHWNYDIKIKTNKKWIKKKKIVKKIKNQ